MVVGEMMNNKEILEKAIKLAVDNGFNHNDQTLIRASKYGIYWKRPNEKNEYYQEVPSLIFNHDFAKAIWGSRTLNALTGEKFVAKKLPEGLIETVYVDFAWEYYLQNMVISEDPITYLGDNLPKETDSQVKKALQFMKKKGIDSLFPVHYKDEDKL